MPDVWLVLEHAVGYFIQGALTMTNVFVAIYEHRHVTDVRVFATEAGARAWKDELAREHWSDYCEGEPPSEGGGRRVL